MRNNSVKLFKFVPAVQEEMSFKDISYLGHITGWGGADLNFRPIFTI